MALDLITVVAERMAATSSSSSSSSSSSGTAFLKDIKAVNAIMDCVLAGSSGGGGGGNGSSTSSSSPESNPQLKITLLRALRAILQSNPSVFLPLLRSSGSTTTTAADLSSRLLALAEHDPEYRWLAEVVGGADPLETPFTYTSWIDMAAYHRGVVESESSSDGGCGGDRALYDDGGSSSSSSSSSSTSRGYCHP